MHGTCTPWREGGTHKLPLTLRVARLHEALPIGACESRFLIDNLDDSYLICALQDN